MSISGLYLMIVVLPALGSLFKGLTLTAILSGLVLFISCSEKDLKWNKSQCLNYSGASFVIALTLGLLSCFIPTKEEVALIYAADYLTGSEKARSLPPKVFNVLNKYLDEALENK